MKKKKKKSQTQSLVEKRRKTITRFKKAICCTTEEKGKVWGEKKETLKSFEWIIRYDWSVTGADMPACVFVERKKK